MIQELKRIRILIRQKWFTAIAKMRLGSYGSHLRVNGMCHFSRHTTVGNYSNFNGMTVLGGVKSI